jgi:hypothetical protein
MNDLDLVRDLRADVPSPTRERLAPGRARLLAYISRPSRPRYARRAVLLVAAAAAASAVAVAVASGAFSGPATRSAAVKPPAIRLTLTAQLLSTAAATVAKHPAVRPGRWFTPSPSHTITGSPPSRMRTGKPSTAARPRTSRTDS